MAGRSTRALAVATAALAVALAGVACSSDAGDGGSSAVATATPESSSGRPAATREAAPTATLEPSTATPEPREIIFSTADGGGGSATGQHSGPLGIVYTDSFGTYDAASRTMYASAAVYLGINETPAATGWLYNDFVVPGEDGETVDAQISAEVAWDGSFAGNGALGTGAAVEMTMKVLDGERVIASQPIYSNQKRESALNIGGFADSSSTAANLTTKLLQGRTYRIQIEVTCSAFSGAIGVATYCVFGRVPEGSVVPAGSVRVTSLSVLF